jgi:hypothetical protein
LARGFYGSLESMNDPKFIREVVSGSPQYAKQRDLLSAIFPDTIQLHSFLNNLEGEQAMRAGQEAFTGSGSPEPEGRSRPHFGISAGSLMPHAYLFDPLHMPPYDPTNAVPKAGQRMAFGAPTMIPGGAQIPSGEPMAQFNRRWPYGASNVPGWTGTPGGWKWEAGLPVTGGALGAAAPYLLDSKD